MPDFPTFSYYSSIFLLTAVMSAGLTYFVRLLALRYKIVDLPLGERKIHRTAMPLLGGLAIFLAFFLVLFLKRDIILATDLKPHHYIGFFTGGLFLMLGGFLDDKYNLRPSRQLLFPLLAVISVVAGGVSIEKITNPLGGFIYLGWWSAVLIGFWLFGMMYTTKLLDGMDGLVTGISSIGAFIIFLFTLTTKYYQPDIAMVSLILSASAFGFLLWNFHPAKIFLGEGGSLFLGYALGVLSIISGGKIAIALLIMGIPILDVMWTIIRRLAKGKNPFKVADRGHLHHRLFDLGLGQRRTVLIFYAFATIFGLSGLFLQSMGKFLAVGVLLLVMAIIIGLFAWVDKIHGSTGAR
jgi:UDP-GlcNAc:undecaprenyl-phosphate GlcNAc-1-phosphate transferase